MVYVDDDVCWWRNTSLFPDYEVSLQKILKGLDSLQIGAIKNLNYISIKGYKKNLCYKVILSSLS